MTITHTQTPRICNGCEKIPILVERITQTATVLIRIKNLHTCPSSVLFTLAAVEVKSREGCCAELLEGKDAGKVAVGVTIAAEAKQHLHRPRK